MAIDLFKSKVLSQVVRRILCLSLLSDGIQFFVEISRQEFVMFPVFVIGTSEHRKGSVSVILEMLDMACESYEVCWKETLAQVLPQSLGSR